jgi:aryl-alcohol dehydrogenase-like predicted oxidoreductase
MADMRYRRLGDSGLVVSVIGLGCLTVGSRLTRGATRQVVAAALDAGINLFDTADRYGRGRSEEYLGAALAGCRDDVIIATKFGMDAFGLSGPDRGARAARTYLVRAVEGSLRRLDTDRIDLYQLHEPDPGTPIEETLAALDVLVRAGKVRYLGLSNLPAWQVTDAAWVVRTGAVPTGAVPFISAQHEYHLLDRRAEREVVPACQRFGLGLLPYAPLAGGLLTGKYQRNRAAPEGSRLSADRFAPALAAAPWDLIEAVTRYAAQRGLSVLDVAIGWLAAQPAVASVIAGASSPEQVRANAAAAAWQPSSDDLAVLDTLTREPS